MTENPKYRSDIDGLRAIAVTLVLVFHAFPDRLSGGFWGVDIFFVISGYLITKIILDELATNNFSIFRFYSRRIRRIFPSLILVLASCFIFGWFVLSNIELQQLGKHTFAGGLFLSNIALLLESGYFDVSSKVKPLLHLWSLGVEEQFYIFWPLFIYVIWWRRFAVRILLLIALAMLV